jgi:hypothetical protein
LPATLDARERTCGIRFLHPRRQLSNGNYTANHSLARVADEAKSEQQRRKDDEAEAILHRIEQSLSLIKVHDRVRYDRLVRDLERVWVTVIPSSRASFNYRIYACMMDRRYVLADSTTPESIASTIVHEATHARLWRRGLRYEEEQRSRIEAICIRSQIAFCAKLPNGAAAREQSERTLTLCDKPEYWANAVMHECHIADSFEALRYLGTPALLLPIIRILRRV